GDRSLAVAEALTSYARRWFERRTASRTRARRDFSTRDEATVRRTVDGAVRAHVAKLLRRTPEDFGWAPTHLDAPAGVSANAASRSDEGRRLHDRACSRATRGAEAIALCPWPRDAREAVFRPNSRAGGTCDRPRTRLVLRRGRHSPQSEDRTRLEAARSS